MQEDMITFELIRKIQLEESNSQKLTKLPENFYESVAKYIQKKKEILKNKKDRKFEIEIKNVRQIVEDIFNRRERKIVNLLLMTERTEIKPENLSGDEKIFFDELLELLKKRRREILEKIFTEKEEKEVLVVFKEDVPSFVGADMKTYGPFKKGDIAKLPKENVDVLLKSNTVEKFEVVV